MSVYHNTLTGTTTIGTGLPEPIAGYAEPIELTKAGKVGKARRTITRVREIPVDPKRLENCTILGPEDHEELTPYEIVRSAFIDEEDTVGLHQFLEVMDQVHMGRSVDLAFWLRVWQRP